METGIYRLLSLLSNKEKQQKREGGKREGRERSMIFFLGRGGGDEKSSTFAAFMASFVMFAIFARETGSLLSYTELSCRGCGEKSLGMNHPKDTETETKGGAGRESYTEPSQTFSPPRLTSLLNCLTTSISRSTASSGFPPWTISRSPRSAITIWALFRIHRMFSTAHA